MKSSDINLLKAKTMLTPQLVAIEGQLRIISVVLLVLVLCAGLFFGVGYVIFRRSLESLSGRKTALIAAVGKELQKEGLYASLKDRLAITGRIIEKQRSWLKVVDLVDRVTLSGPRTSFAVGENNEVNLSITSNSLEDAFDVVDRVIAEVEGKNMINPVLQSVQYGKDGSVRISLTFTPIF